MRHFLPIRLPALLALALPANAHNGATANDAQDGCEIYLSLNGENTVQYVAYGDYREVLSIAAEQRRECQIGITRSAHTLQYEWRFDIGPIASAANNANELCKTQTTRIATIENRSF